MSSTDKPGPISDQHHERRSFHRIMFDAACTLHQGESRWECQMFDISLKGILLKKPDDFDGDLSQGFEVAIKLSEDGIAIIMSLKLAHQQGDHLGFHCDYIDIDSITHLRRLVELNLGDPELLDREINALSTEAMHE